MPRKVLDVRKECVRLSCQRQTKSPSGLSVGGLFAYRHAPERLTSRTPWNKSSAYVSNTHYKSEIFKSIILSVLYHIRHFDVFVVKRKTLSEGWPFGQTFVKVYRLWGVVDDYHFIVIQLNFFYKVIGNLVSACQPRIKRTLPKRRYFRAFCQILVWSTSSTSALAFTKNHQKYRRFGC